MSYFFVPFQQTVLTWIELSSNFSQQAYFKSQSAIYLNSQFPQYEIKKQETLTNNCLINFQHKLGSSSGQFLFQRQKLKKQKIQNPDDQKYKLKERQDGRICQINPTVCLENQDIIFKNEEKLIQKQYDYMRKQIKLNKIKNIKSDEYRPFQKKKKTHFTKYKENQNRNIIPNSINQILSYILKPLKSQLIVQRIFNKYPQCESYTIKRFYQYQNLVKDKITNYASQCSLSLVTQLYEPKCEIYSESEQRYYIKICRILIRHFLQQDSIFNILTSKRMKNNKKSDHLKVLREIYERVVNTLKG